MNFDNISQTNFFLNFPTTYSLPEMNFSKANEYNSSYTPFNIHETLRQLEQGETMATSNFQNNNITVNMMSQTIEPALNIDMSRPCQPPTLVASFFTKMHSLL